MVAEINKVTVAKLGRHYHLFGSDRLLPARALRDCIAALPDRGCFYCGGPEPTNVPGQARRASLLSATKRTDRLDLAPCRGRYW